MRKIIFFTLAGIAALATGILVQHYSTGTANPEQAKLEHFTFPDLEGRQRSSQEWQGQIRVINFWATWCAPCREEIPEFIHLQKQFANNGVQFIGVAIDSAAAVAAYIQPLSINYPILIAEDDGIGLASRSGNVLNAIPFTLVVDTNDVIVHRQPGTFSTESLKKILDSIQ